MPDAVRWWATKVRQFRVHLFGRVRPSERASLAAWLTPAELALFDRMHPADQRHGVDVMAGLRAAAVAERDVLVAGLLHDAGKGRVGAWPRVAHALVGQYGPVVARLVGWLPGMRRDLAILGRHAERSAELAAAFGCSRRTIELIRWQEDPRDPEFGRLLELVDEAN